MDSFSSCETLAVACSRGSRTRRPVTLLPLLALCRSAACQRTRGCSFHHAIPGCQVWNGFPSKRVSHCAGVGARVQLSGQTLWRFRGIYHGIKIPTGIYRNISVNYLSLSHLLSEGVISYIHNKLSCRSSFED